MGFLTNLASEGLYGALVDAHYDRVAADICKRNGLGSLNVINNLDSITDEEYESDDTKEELDDALTFIGYDSSDEPKLSGLDLLMKCAEDAKCESKEEII